MEHSKGWLFVMFNISSNMPRNWSAEPRKCTTRMEPKNAPICMVCERFYGDCRVLFSTPAEINSDRWYLTMGYLCKMVTRPADLTQLITTAVIGGELCLWYLGSRPAGWACRQPMTSMAKLAHGGAGQTQVARGDSHAKHSDNERCNDGNRQTRLNYLGKHRARPISGSLFLDSLRSLKPT